MLIMSRETDKQKHRNVEVHSLHVHEVWPKTYLTQLGKKSALLNRAGSQLRAVPYPV